MLTFWDLFFFPHLRKITPAHYNTGLVYSAHGELRFHNSCPLRPKSYSVGVLEQPRLSYGFRDPPASAFRVLRLKVCATTARLTLFLKTNKVLRCFLSKIIFSKICDTSIQPNFSHIKIQDRGTFQKREENLLINKMTFSANETTEIKLEVPLPVCILYKMEYKRTYYSNINWR